MKRKHIFTISISIFILVLSTFLIWKFSISNDKQNSMSTDDQTGQSSTFTELSKDEKIYKQLIGNLADTIYDSEKEQVKALIKELIEIEDNEDASSKKTTIYENIIKVLDEVTLRGHSQEDLSEYKSYFDSLENIVGDRFTPEMVLYTIESNGEITPAAHVDKTKDSEYKELWERVKRVIPFELLNGIKYFTPFEVDKDSNGYVAGFMQPVDFDATSYEWSIGVASNAKDADILYVLIHEYGHFISLKDARIKLTGDYKRVESEGGELLQSFITECLGYIEGEFENININNHYLFYARHKDDFVTMYAASNLLEDFAESFAKFVADSTYESEILKNKMNFFNSNAELVSIKNKILTNIKNNNMGEIPNSTQ